MTTTAQHKPKREPPMSRLLFQAWCEAAEKWKRLRSDPTLAACVAARSAWYQVVYGVVPVAAKLESEETA